MPRRPSQLRWIMPPRAFSAWAVQMLWVAFSRRMCCSRVCRASTKPRRPSASVGLPGDPARHAPDLLVGRAEEAEGRAAVVEAVAERLALADGDVDAAFARRAQDAERDRVAGGDQQRARPVGDLGDPLEVLDAAEEARVLDEDGGGLLVDRLRESVEVGDAVRPARPRPRRSRSPASRSPGSRGCAGAGPGRRRNACAWSPRSPDSPAAATVEGPS